MKKILSVFLMSFIVFALSACNANVVKIEDYEWKMRTVMSNDTEAAQSLTDTNYGYQAGSAQFFILFF